MQKISIHFISPFNQNVLKGLKTAKLPDFCAFYGTNEFGTGRSPFAPNVVIRIPAVERCTNQFAVDGRKAAVSKRPSPT